MTEPITRTYVVRMDEAFRARNRAGVNRDEHVRTASGGKTMIIVVGTSSLEAADSRGRPSSGLPHSRRATREPLPEVP